MIWLYTIFDWILYGVAGVAVIWAIVWVSEW